MPDPSDGTLGAPASQPVTAGCVRAEGCSTSDGCESLSRCVEAASTSRGQKGHISSPSYLMGWNDAKAGRQYGEGHDGPRVAGGLPVICGVIAPNQGPNGEPLACAWPDGHLPDTPHSWSWVPTVHSGGSGTQ